MLFVQIRTALEIALMKLVQLAGITDVRGGAAAYATALRRVYLITPGVMNALQGILEIADSAIHSSSRVDVRDNKKLVKLANSLLQQLEELTADPNWLKTAVAVRAKLRNQTVRVEPLEVNDGMIGTLYINDQIVNVVSGLSAPITKGVTIISKENGPREVDRIRAGGAPIAWTSDGGFNGTAAAVAAGPWLF